MPSENFVSRWSRRKQQVEQEQDHDEIGTDELALDNTKNEVSEQLSEEDRLEKLNALTDEDMPDLETLGEDSDFAGFMSVNVSEELRKLALQKLFHGKTYNIRDGLDEYDGDYTSFEKLDPSIITADMKHLMEVEAEKLLAKKKAQEKEEQLQAEAALIADSDDVKEELQTQDDAEQVAIEATDRVDDINQNQIKNISNEDAA